MPVLVPLQIVPQEAGWVNPADAPAHGWFLALCSALDPALSAAFHAANETRPFALSPLFGLSTEGRFRAGEILRLRAAFFDDATTQNFLAALPLLTRLPPLGQAPCLPANTTLLPALRPVACAPDADGCQYTPWDALRDTPPAERLRVEFVTPTAFRHNGENLLFPEPARLLADWQAAWAGRADQPASPLLLTEGLRVARYDLRTSLLLLKKGKQIGFQGSMEMVWAPDAPQENKQAAAALGAWANYCGTGAKTALGMGQTRVWLDTAGSTSAGRSRRERT